MRTIEINRYNRHLELLSCKKCKRNLDPELKPSLSWVCKKTGLCNLCSKKRKNEA